MIVATSLANAFAVVGGVLLVPDSELRRKIRTVGSSMVFSGPIQPANLGAAVASARLHLSEALAGYQADLCTRIALCNRLMRSLGPPLVSQPVCRRRWNARGSVKPLT